MDKNLGSSSLTESVLIGEALQYAQNQDYFAAADCLEKAIVHYPNDSQVQQYLIQFCIKCFEISTQRNEPLRGAEYISKALMAHPRLVDVQSYLNINNIFLEFQQFEKSVRLLMKGLEGYLNEDQLFVGLGEVRLAQGMIGNALVSFQKAIALNPDKYLPTNKSHVNFNLPARVWRIRGELCDLEIRLEETAKQIDVLSIADAERFDQALSLAKVGMLNQSVSILEELKKTNLNSPDIQCALAIVYLAWWGVSGRTEYLHSAQRELHEIVKIRNDWELPYYYLGQIARALSNDFNQPLQLYRKAIEINPEHEQSLMGAGEMISRMNGQNAEALDLIARYLKVRNRRQDSHPLGKAGVRFLSSDNTTAMGHLGELPDTFMKLKKLGQIPNYEAIILTPDSMVANTTLLECWKEHFSVVTDDVHVAKLLRVSKELDFDTSFYLRSDGQAYHMIPMKSHLEYDWNLAGRGPLLKFQGDKVRAGWAFLESLGIPGDAWFVTAHAREGGFKREAEGGFNSHRNTDITTYEKAFDEIRSRGGWVIRIGEPSMKPIKPMERVFDYAHSDLKSSYLDIFLLTQCRFYLSGTAGAYSTPFSFGVPVAFANWTPSVPLLYGSQDLYIYKLLWSQPLDRYLTLREAMSEPFLYSQENTRFFERGIRFVDNSADEIADLVKEMMDRLDGKVVYEASDHELQRKFSQLLPARYGICSTRLGREYSRKYEQIFA